MSCLWTLFHFYVCSTYEGIIFIVINYIHLLLTLYLSKFKSKFYKVSNTLFLGVSQTWPDDQQNQIRESESEISRIRIRSAESEDDQMSCILGTTGSHWDIKKQVMLLELLCSQWRTGVFLIHCCVSRSRLVILVSLPFRWRNSDFTINMQPQHQIWKGSGCNRQLPQETQILPVGIQARSQVC